MTGDFGFVVDKLKELLETMSNSNNPSDYLHIDTCLNARGHEVVRFDVVKSDDDGVERIYRTEFNVDKFRM